LAKIGVGLAIGWPDPDRPGLPHRRGVVVAHQHRVARVPPVEVLDLAQLRLARPRAVAAEHPVDGVAGLRAGTA
jgi:hypothetical protein